MEDVIILETGTAFEQADIKTKFANFAAISNLILTLLSFVFVVAVFFDKSFLNNISLVSAIFFGLGFGYFLSINYLRYYFGNSTNKLKFFRIVWFISILYNFALIPIHVFFAVIMANGWGLFTAFFIVSIIYCIIMLIGSFNTFLKLRNLIKAKE